MPAALSRLMPEVLSASVEARPASPWRCTLRRSWRAIATRIAVGTIQLNDRPSDPLPLADEFLSAQRESQMDDRAGLLDHCEIIGEYGQTSP
jgi:hypothetical protein